jgi:RNA polymerase sigma factor (TIGR02999 family)
MDTATTNTYPSPQKVTEFLAAWSRGDAGALDELIPLVHAELRNVAQRQLRSERPNHTLQPTALVNEAYIRLAGQQHPEFEGRAHFFGVAARIMRRILVDYARQHAASKRGGEVQRLSLEEIVETPEEPAQVCVDLIALDEALTNLEKLDPQQSRIVELRYFGGLSIPEAARVVGVSPATVKRDWVTAQAWLRREIERGSAHES